MNRTSTGKLQCIPKIAQRNTRILILGTFPSEIALRNNEYYGNPGNHFWEILGFCLDIKDFEKLPYEERLRYLRLSGIGLWDAIYRCNRITSSDARIEDAEYNDLSILKKACPNLQKIVLSSKFMLQTKNRRRILESADIPFIAAPSPSRRYIIPLDEKKRKWKEILKA